MYIIIIMEIIQGDTIAVIQADLLLHIGVICPTRSIKGIRLSIRVPTQVVSVIYFQAPIQQLMGMAYTHLLIQPEVSADIIMVFLARPEIFMALDIRPMEDIYTNFCRFIIFSFELCGSGLLK